MGKGDVKYEMSTLMKIHVVARWCSSSACREEVRSLRPMLGKSRKMQKPYTSYIYKMALCILMKIYIYVKHKESLERYTQKN